MVLRRLSATADMSFLFGFPSTILPHNNTVLVDLWAATRG